MIKLNEARFALFCPVRAARRFRGNKCATTVFQWVVIIGYYLSIFRLVGIRILWVLFIDKEIRKANGYNY